MQGEEAFYFEYMLLLGITEEYQQWLQTAETSENPLSDIVLELSYCESDVPKTISVLHRYYQGKPLDRTAVCNRFRLFFKEQYHAKSMDKEAILSAMILLACSVEAPYRYDRQSFGSMYYMEDLSVLVEEGLLPQATFDAMFLAYLEDGILPDTQTARQSGCTKKSSWFSRIMHGLRKAVCPKKQG